MVKYVPSDNPSATRTGISRARGEDGLSNEIRLHLDEFKAFGPPPREYYVNIYRSHGVNKPDYEDRSPGRARPPNSTRKNNIHPCSPDARLSTPPPTFAEEFDDDRKPIVGFFPPPLKYVSGQMTWRHQPSWEAALAAALATKGIQKDGRPLTEDDLQARLSELVDGPNGDEKPSTLLHHPADRHMAVFEGEPSASLLARKGSTKRSFSLIIVCPLQPADGSGWARIWNTHNRPPIIVRWSTGEQSIHEPMVLMCLPKPETVAGMQSVHKSVEWFTMEPAPASPFEGVWHDMWRK
jgi:hypothetical protein